MADFKDFLSTDGYLARLTRLNEIKTALAQWLSVGSHSNVPEGAIRWSQSQKRWEVYSGGTWGALETEYNVNVKQLQGAEPNTAVSNNSIVKRTGTGQVKAANPSANDEVTTRAFSDSRYVRQADLGESGGLTVENAAKLGGQLPAYYRNADNINAGTLPVARGGTGAGNAAGARSSFGLGSAATMDAQTSVADTAPDRLMRVGAFGWGTKLPSGEEDYNNLPSLYPYTGFVPLRLGANSANRPPLSTYNYVMQIVHDSSTGGVTQIAFPYGTGVGALFPMSIRVSRDGGWSAWSEFYTSDHSGPGSGLDADTLDGMHADELLPPGARIVASLLVDTTKAAPVIRNSHNVAGVTKNSTGDFTIHFEQELPSTDYVIATSTYIGTAGAASAVITTEREGYPRATTDIRLVSRSSSGSLFDWSGVSVIVVM